MVYFMDFNCSSDMIRAEANAVGGCGRSALPPGDHLSEVLLSCRTICDLNVYFWKIFRRDNAQKHEFLCVK